MKIIPILISFSEKGVVKESKKARKRREWMLRKSRIQHGIKSPTEHRYRGDWAYLPDLVLEEVFQYLGYKVRKQSIEYLVGN